MIVGSTRTLITLLRPWIKTLYDDYLCLVALKKQQIYEGRSQKSIGKLGKWSTPKRVRIRPKDSATAIFS